MSVPRISNNSFWGFGSASVLRFTNFLDFNFMFNSAFNFECPFNCGGYYDGALSARAWQHPTSRCDVSRIEKLSATYVAISSLV